jgi:hypothetical protein
MTGDIVTPRTVVLPLAGGRAITIREELNHGEHVAMLARMYRESDAGRMTIDPLLTGDALIVAYLVDWTLTDASGRPIEIRGLTATEVQDVINNLRHPTVAAIKLAIETHHEAVNARADELKKTDSSDDRSLATSRSAG